LSENLSIALTVIFPPSAGLTVHFKNFNDEKN
jgi:hypothetical protein